jgi:hypothetical protein
VNTVNIPDDQDDILLQLGRDVQILIQESAALLAHLHVEDGEHHHFQLPYDLAGAKAYFLSRCLMDVQAVAGVLIRLTEHLHEEGERADRTTPPMRAIFLTSILTELGLWRRRLTEALARLVLFSTTNTDAHYFHYLLVSEAEESRREAENVRQDFGAASRTLVHRAEDLRAQIAAVGVALPVWHLRAGRNNRPRQPSAAEIIREALAHAQPHERTALGYSYLHAFSAPSSLVHFSTHARRERRDDELMRFSLRVLFMLAHAITTRVGALAGIPTALPLVRGGHAAAADLPEVGDFVAVTLDRNTVYLAEVLAATQGIGVIGRVRVRFIGEAPYADIVDDEFPSDLVHLVQRRAELTTAVLGNLPPEWQVGGEDLDNSCRRAVEFAWQTALRDLLLRHLREG